MSPDEALAVLGLDPGASAEVRKTVFRNCVKACRPDRPGGDAERFRRVIEAYRRLEQADARPAAARPEAADTPEVEITIEEACLGGARILPVVADRAFYWRIEPGLRDGDLAREPTPFGEFAFRVRIASEPGRKVMGSDLWITLGVDPWLLEDGGRLEASTPFGPRSVWVPRGLPESAMLRLKDCGLPARGGYPQGHALLKLVPDPALAGSGLRAVFSRLSSALAPNARASLRAGMLR
jgi:curved DNA-binding protein